MWLPKIGLHTMAFGVTDVHMSSFTYEAEKGKRLRKCLCPAMAYLSFVDSLKFPKYNENTRVCFQLADDCSSAEHGQFVVVHERRLAGVTTIARNRCVGEYQRDSRVGASGCCAMYRDIERDFVMEAALAADQ
jgi:hypothetical protein